MSDKPLIRMFATATIAGNITDLVSYAEPLYDEGYDVRVYLTWYGTDEKNIVTFDEMYEKWCTKIPRDNFTAMPGGIYNFPTEMDRNKDLIIINAPVWQMFKQIRPAHMCKAIFSLREGEKWPETINFTPTRALASRYDYLYVARPFDSTPFRENRQKNRKYEIADAIVANDKKGLDTLNKLSKNYKVKLAITALKKYQIDDVLPRYKNLDYTLNASRHQVAELLGDSKILVHPSETEQASCVLDEGMLAGCYPLLKTDASVSYGEQGLGHESYFTDYDDLTRRLDVMLESYDQIMSDKISDDAYNEKDRRFNAPIWKQLVKETIEKLNLSA